MRTILRALVPLAGVLCMFVGFAVSPVASAHGLDSKNATCSGGTITAPAIVAPGTYGKLRITGICAIPFGTVKVREGLDVEEGATLFASIPGAPANSTVNVWGGVKVDRGGTFVFGCAPSFGCNYFTKDSIHGGVRSEGALAVIIHGSSISGGIRIKGGGGGLNCAPLDVLHGNPAFNDVEDNTVSGGLSMTDVTSCWFGMARDTVNGSVKLNDNNMADPDAMEILSNTINGSLSCHDNSPAPKASAENPSDPTGPRIPMPNDVEGKSSGQCKGF